MTTVSISDINAGTYVCTTSTGICDISYLTPENI